MHPSANSILFTWGRYKGSTLGQIFQRNINYIEWIATTDTIPEPWPTAAKMLLKGQDISDLKLPRVKETTVKNKTDQNTVVELFLVDKSTAAVVMPYDRQLLATFKYEIDGRKWNSDERHWEFPAVHLPKVIKVFENYNVKYDKKVEKLLNELVERREDLDEIRSQEDDIQYANRFYNNTKIGEITNWNEVNTYIHIRQYIKK